MVHPRVIKWHEELERKSEKDEEESVLREMDSEEALEAFRVNGSSELQRL